MFGVPGGRCDTRSLWGLNEMHETLWFFGVCDLMSGERQSSLCLGALLLSLLGGEWNSTSIVYIYLQGKTARVLTSGHLPGT